MGGTVAVSVVAVVIGLCFVVGGILVKAGAKAIGAVVIIIGVFLLLGTHIGRQIMGGIGGMISGWQNAK